MKYIVISLLFFIATSPIAHALESREIIIKDHRFSPEILTIPADTRIKLIVHNQDSTAEEFESNDFKREKIIPGNSKATIFISPLKAGEYHFFGEFNAQTAQGTLKVE